MFNDFYTRIDASKVTSKSVIEWTTGSDVVAFPFYQYAGSISRYYFVTGAYPLSNTKMSGTLLQIDASASKVLGIDTTGAYKDMSSNAVTSGTVITLRY